jgi:hypothetical protein
MPVFREIWRVLIECLDVRATFLFRIFWLLKNIFSVVGAYAPMFRIKFPHVDEILKNKFDWYLIENRLEVG